MAAGRSAPLCCRARAAHEEAEVLLSAGLSGAHVPFAAVMLRGSVLPSRCRPEALSSSLPAALPEGLGEEFGPTLPALQTFGQRAAAVQERSLQR